MGPKSTFANFEAAYAQPDQDDAIVDCLLMLMH